MRMRFARPLLAVFAVAALAACTSGPGGGSPGGTGAQGTGTQSPGTSSSGADGGTPTGTPATTLPPEDATPDPSVSYPGTQPTPGQGDAELSILVRTSADAAPDSLTLVCRGGVPAAESKHPTAAAACTALKNNPALLERTPPSGKQVCTEIYGGPQTATVTGAVDGKAVDVSYSRTDGCEIAAWDAVRDVLGSSGGAV